VSAPVAAGVDALAFDFCDSAQGLFGHARIELATITGSGTAAAALFERGEAVASIARHGIDMDVPADWSGVSVAGLRVEDDGSRAAVSLELAEARFDLEVERVIETGYKADTEPARLARAEQLVASTRVSGTVERDGRKSSLDCPGLITRTFGTAGWDDLALLRTLGAVFEDGTLLSAWAVRPGGAGGHGDEAVGALVAGPESDPLVAADALLSTHYDDQHGHVRASLELALDVDLDLPPRRAAGEALCRQPLALGPARLDLAFFRWAMAGNAGVGRYEILRRVTPTVRPAQ
jgi:hypothetical protein